MCVVKLVKGGIDNGRVNKRESRVKKALPALEKVQSAMKIIVFMLPSIRTNVFFDGVWYVSLLYQPYGNFESFVHIRAQSKINMQQTNPRCC
jgi:hypothetical protein